MSRRAAPALALCLLLVACRQDHFGAGDLPHLVLQRAEAPVGTKYVDVSSGPETLEQYAKDDRIKLVALRDAGFVTAYFSFFFSPGLFQGESEFAPNGSLADSFALLFKTNAGAERGLQIVEEAVRRDGSGLIDRPSEGLGEESFALEGSFQSGFPPGYLYAWRVGNGVFGLVAAGARGSINENAARKLAEIMESKTR